MKFQYAKLGALSTILAVSLSLFGCGDDVALGEEAVDTFSTIDTLTEKCNEDTDGLMVFVKSDATMYVCSENKWVPMQSHNCYSEELEDKSGLVIYCNGDSIGVVKQADMEAINKYFENLSKTYTKHVVVRFPVQAEKNVESKDIYEEIWKNLKSGDHTELTVMDLDEKLNATGRMFVADLFGDERNGR